MTSQPVSGVGLSDAGGSKRYPLSSINPTNPLRHLRKKLGFTQEGLADYAGTSRIFVVRAEQGVYEEPSTTLLDAMRKYHKRFKGDVYKWEFPSPSEIDRDYNLFQLHTRRRHYGQLLINFDFLAFSPSLHPFLIWREASEVNASIAISKYYCVHPAIIHKFEKQTNLMHTVPDALRSALLESGYNQFLLDELEWAYTKHREWKASKVSFSPVSHTPAQEVPPVGEQS